MAHTVSGLHANELHTSNLLTVHDVEAISTLRKTGVPTPPPLQYPPHEKAGTSVCPVCPPVPRVWTRA